MRDSVCRSEVVDLQLSLESSSSWPQEEQDRMTKFDCVRRKRLGDYISMIRGCSEYLGDNCIQNFIFVRYIVTYTVGNFILRRRFSGDVKHYFRTCKRRYTSTNENFEHGNPHSNVLLFNFYTSKARDLQQNISFFSNVKLMH